MDLGKTNFIGAAALIFGVSAAAAQPDPKVYPSIAAIANTPDAPFCTGTVVSHKHILTAASCLIQPDGSMREGLVALPGLNLGADGPSGSGKLRSRAFGARIHVSNASRIAREGADEEMDLPSFLSQDMALLEIARGKGDNGLTSAFPAAFLFSEYQPDVGDPVTVRGYTGKSGEASGTLQSHDCKIEGETAASLLLDCILPSGMLGSLAMQDDAPLGVITATQTGGALTAEGGTSGGALVARMAHPGFHHIVGYSHNPERISAVNIQERLPVAYSGIEAVNRCDQDVHLGLLWFDAFEETTKTLAKRLPAQSHTLLPAATRADTVFTYARSEDGTMIWQGKDGKARIKGMLLPMQARRIGENTKDVSLLFECEK